MIYDDAVKFFGIEKQLIKIIEEMAELTQAICKAQLGYHNNVIEEIADVEIVLAQVKIGLGVEQMVEQWKAVKLKKLEGIIYADIDKK